MHLSVQMSEDMGPVSWAPIGVVCILVHVGSMPSDRKHCWGVSSIYESCAGTQSISIDEGRYAHVLQKRNSASLILVSISSIHTNVRVSYLYGHGREGRD